MTTNKTGGIYIHIPFCLRKCNYCSFLSFPAGEMQSWVGRYVDCLIREIKMRGHGEKADTVYFGGGTPSLLSAEQISRILGAVHDTFDIDSAAEITLEANPATIDPEKLGAFRSLGINRLSMGVQSTDDEVLKYLGRAHTAARARKDVQDARRAGFTNINMDLIFAVPGTSVEDVMKDLERLVSLEPEHISFYSLQLEEGTPFFRDFEEGRLQEVSDDVDREMYHRGCDFLRDHGYEHYEISNFARPGRRSRHNSKYWSMAPYWGFGLGASSYLPEPRGLGTDEKSFSVRTRKFRIVNESDMGRYCGDLERGEYRPAEVHENSAGDDVSEGVFTGLRRAGGITFEEIRELSGPEDDRGGGEEPRDWFFQYYKEEMPELMAFRDSGFVDLDGKGMRLTEKGIDISNRIMALFV